MFARMDMLARPLRGLDRLLRTASILSIGAAGLLILTIVGLGTVDMVQSFALNHPIPAATNFSEEILPASVLLSAGMVIRNRSQIVVDVLTERMRGGLLRAFGTINALLTLVFFLILAYGAVVLAVASVRIGETAVAAVEFAVWPMKVAFAFGTCIACLEAARIVLLSVFSETTAPISHKSEVI